MYKKWKSFFFICTRVLIFAFMFSVWIGCLQRPLDKARIQFTQKEIAEIEEALKKYSIEVGEYPTTEQGLDALWRAPESSEKIIQKWWGPYVQSPISTDAWNNPYVYRSPGTRLGYDYDLLSYGRDGKLGGVGFDADIWVGDTPQVMDRGTAGTAAGTGGIVFGIAMFFVGISAVAAGAVAKSRGRNWGTWFFIGLILGPIGLIISLCLPKTQDKRSEEALVRGELRKCPYCRELVKADAIKCRFCHESLQDTMQ